MDLTACFLPKPVTGVNGNGMHTNMSIAKKGKNLFYDKKGQDGLSTFALELHQPDPGERQRHLPDPQLERQLVPPARPALRGAEPDQGLGRSTAARWSASRSATRVGAHRGALDRARRQPVPRDLLAVQDRARGPAAATTTTTASGQRTRFLPDNIYDAIRLFKGSKFAQELLGAEVHEKYAELKLASGRALRQGARRARQAQRDPVPPRGHQPVPLGPVLEAVRPGPGPGGRGRRANGPPPRLRRRARPAPICGKLLR